MCLAHPQAVRLEMGHCQGALPRAVGRAPGRRLVALGCGPDVKHAQGSFLGVEEAKAPPLNSLIPEVQGSSGAGWGWGWYRR